MRGGSLRVRKVVTTNSQEKKKTVKNLGKKNKAVKSLDNFNLIALWYFKNCLTVYVTLRVDT